MNQEQIYRIALTFIPKVGSVLAKNLISYCGGAEGVFHAKKKALLKIPGIGPSIANEITGQKILSLAEKEAELLEKHAIRALFYLEKDYPQRLKHYEDCPLILFYKGNANLNHFRTVAVVGTRTPTQNGRTNCEALVEGLTEYKPHIISGLAFGIDITAHKKSLKAGLETIGVMGHGMHRIYPSEHLFTARQMMDQGGIISELPFHTEPMREHFPMRNRIIAGMSDALVVVETKRKGGSMISAEFANQYHKDVFAFPGRIRDQYSTGCNFLIKTHRAALIEGANDLIYNLSWEKEDAPGRAVQTELFVSLSDQERNIVEILRKSEQTAIDTLSYLSEMTPGTLSTILLQLEFKGVIKNLPGKRYMLL